MRGLDDPVASETVRQVRLGLRRILLGYASAMRRSELVALAQAARARAGSAPS